MPRWFLPLIIPLFVSASFAAKGESTAPLPDDAGRLALERTRSLVEEIRAASFPELKDASIKVELLDSEADYFRTRFSIPHFLAGRRMRYLIKVNPAVFSLAAPEAGVRAIIAHELGHIVWFRQRNRLELLGLIRLTSKKYTARFERWTDLQAIARGYGEGLKEYRRWLYRHVPPQKLGEKRRNYFSPEEIDAILARIRQQPELLKRWLKKVPLDIQSISGQPSGNRSDTEFARSSKLNHHSE
ncbi:MAG TPA: hypothetical protein VFD58_22400 [Blastocatellia bacterium]|nr:hypothetical protein [Blastocatellia bacterium]